MMYQAKLIEVIPGLTEWDSAVLDDGKRIFQLGLPKSCNISEYVGKEIIISIDGEEVEITEVSAKRTVKADTDVDGK
ncbi:MAG: hypothetical protein PHR82_09030 [Endomicrobiaceae bacterium]|nr:hypothetical protein [Endomicrobiaceae bacterium]